MCGFVLLVVVVVGGGGGGGGGGVRILRQHIFSGNDYTIIPIITNTIRVRGRER